MFILCSYLAPEYAENGMVSVRTDVYAYGITLIQLISGRKVVNPNIEDHCQSLRQWVCPMHLCHHKLIYYLWGFFSFVSNYI